MIRRSIAITLVISITWVSMWTAAPGWAQSTSSSELSRDEALRQNESLTKTLEDLRSAIDRSQFDTEALLEELDYDAERIIAFVEEEIDFENYVGVLRGARGTLMSRAGNAFDQAILLAHLLKGAGLDARIARGALPADQASALLNQVPQERSELPLFRDAGQEDAMEGLSQRLGVDLESYTKDQLKTWELTTTQLEADVETTRSQLSSLMASHKTPDDTYEAFSSLSGQNFDYAWVQFRSMASQPWQDLHPAMPVGYSVAEIVPEEIFTESVDRDLQHEFRFQVFIEKRVLNKKEEIPLMDPWVRPAANLHGEVLTFTNLASDVIGLSDLDQLDEAIASSETFFPTFNGEVLPKAFDRLGNVIPADVASSPYAGVFEQVGKKTSQAAAALGGLGSSSSSDSKSKSGPMALERQWIEYTLVKPDGEETRFRRTIFTQPRGQDSDNSSTSTQYHQDIHALTDQVSFMMSTGRIPQTFLADSTLARLLRILALQRAVLTAGQLDHVAVAKLVQQQLSNQDLSRSGLLALYALFDRGVERSGVAYRAEPSLVAHRERVEASGTAMATVDIIHNPRVALRRDSGTPRHSFETALSAGVWESFAEGIPGASSSSTVTAAGLIQDSARQGAELLTVTPERRDSLADLALPAESRLAIEDDLQNGYVVIVPSDSFGRDWAWWRIDPGTGNSLARAGEGLGQTTSEYVIGLILVAVFVLSTINAFMGCFGGDDWDGLQGPESTEKSIKLGACGICALFVGALAAITVYVAAAVLTEVVVASEVFAIGLGEKALAFWAIVTFLISEACGAVGWAL